MLLGWFSCVCLIVGGLLMICGSRNDDDYDEELTYRPRNDPSAYRTPKKNLNNYNNYNTNTNGGRNNPSYVADVPSNYHRNTNLPNRVYIWKQRPRIGKKRCPCRANQSCLHWALFIKPIYCFTVNNSNKMKINSDHAYLLSNTSINQFIILCYMFSTGWQLWMQK